jgi:hypothetical protein
MSMRNFILAFIPVVLPCYWGVAQIAATNDAVRTAPKSHRVVFENAFVRVLEVSVVMEPQRES